MKDNRILVQGWIEKAQLAPFFYSAASFLAGGGMI